MGATTATTLRLTEPWKGSGRIVVGDSWFGSCNTAEWLMDVNGLYSILAVKTGHKGYPKQKLIEEVQGERFKNAFMTVDVELECGTTTFIAGASMDKKPQLLIGTCGMSTPGEPIVRERREFKDGAITKTRYTASQSHMSDMYRGNFNAIDLFNRSCFGNYTM